MEHYFIYLCNEIPTSEEESFAVHYIKSLLPSSAAIGHPCTSLTAPLLRCESSYFSVLTSSLKLEENSEWRLFSGEANLNDLTASLLQGNGEKSDEVSKANIFSTHIHCLADQLPACGSFKLDVIISHAVLKDFSLNEDVEFSGALYRLHKWHGAHTAIITPDEAQNSSLAEWCQILDAELVSVSSTPVSSFLIWRGSIQFPRPNAPPVEYPGFSLKLEYSEDKSVSEYATPSSRDTSEKDEKTESDHLVLSPILRVIDECSLNSIPPYIILPFAFKLCSNKSGTKDFEKLLAYFGSRKRATLIIKMGFSSTTEKSKPDKDLSATKWHKMISSGHIKFPEACLPSVGNYITFAVTSSSRSGTVFAYPLRDPSRINAQFYFNLVDSLNSVRCSEGSNNPSDEVVGEREESVELKLPHLTASPFEALLNEISSLETSNDQRHFHNNLISQLESTMKNCKQFSILHGGQESIIESVEIDPTDWPERIYLLQKLIQSEKERKSSLPNAFHARSPQRSQSSVSFTTEDAGKYFHPSGEAKDLTSAECIYVISSASKHPKQSYVRVLETKWPDVIKCLCDDVYYNSNKQAEEKEAVGNEMARFYVQDETASTCNSQQLNPNAVIVVKSRSQSSLQKGRSPAKYSSPSKRNQNMRNKFKADANPSQKASCLIPKHAATANAALKFSSEFKNLGKRQMLKKNSQPTRCSPRKKSLVKYSQATSSRNSIDLNKKQSNSQLPDLAKKKLRVAVVTALESNGISLNDKFFRPCFKKLFTVCQAFVQDIPRKKGSTSEHMQRIADAHVKQVIEFEKGD